MVKNIAWRIYRKQFRTPEDLPYQVHKNHGAFRLEVVVLCAVCARYVKEG